MSENSQFLTQHDVEVGILMRRLCLVAGEGESHCQSADTSAIHIDDQDEFRHPVPVGAFTGGETACGECRGGLKQRVKQLYVRLHDRKQEAGNQDESRRHHHDGGRLLHHRRGNGLVVEFDVLLALHRGNNRLDDDEKRGGFDTAARGAGRTAYEDRNQNQNDCRYMHHIDIQHIES